MNPLSPDYFNPKYWMIMGKRVHRSRFLHFAQNRLPSLLRPAYNFFGVPLIQMLEPYRQGFDRARLASLDSIDNHALLYLKTSMAKALQADCNDPANLKNRVRLMQLNRSNDGIAVVDKDTEDFAQINTPLTELADLVTLNLELIPMVTRMSVTKMFGTPPKGLDASGDNYRYDRAETINGMQKNILHDNVVRMYQLIMLNKWGEIFSPITYDWNSTLEITEEEKLQARERQANIDTQYLAGENPPLHPFEVRARLSKDLDSGYYGIIVPEGYEEAFEEEWEDQDEEEPRPDMGGIEPNEEGEAPPINEESGGKPSFVSRSPRAGSYRAHDDGKEFREEDHARDEGGKFTSGGGGAGGGKEDVESGGSEGERPFSREDAKRYIGNDSYQGMRSPALNDKIIGRIETLAHANRAYPVDSPTGRAFLSFSGGSRSLNEKLNKTKGKAVDWRVKAMDAAIEEAEPLQSDVVVHSRVSMDFGEDDYFGYTSTSLDPLVPAIQIKREHSRAISILLPKGAKCAYVPKILEHMKQTTTPTFPDKDDIMRTQEVVLPRASKFRKISEKEYELIID